MTMTTAAPYPEWLDECRRLDAILETFGVGPMKTGTTWLIQSLGRHPGLGDGRQGRGEQRGFYRKGVVGDWANHMTPEFGDELLAIAQEALGAWKTPTLMVGGGASGSLSAVGGA